MVNEIDKALGVVGDVIPPEASLNPKTKMSEVSRYPVELEEGEDIDADSLVRHSAENYPRTVVKRPNYAPPLWRKPDEQFGGKLIRYDVYFQSRSKD